MSAKRIHLLGHSHIDPIWLWRRRNGHAEWLNTCWSVAQLMDEYKDFKFCMSSASAWQWIEKCDPVLFAKIKNLVEAGRWEPVGGWLVESDSIISSGESLLRQAEHGKAYFKSRFGFDVRTAFNPDAFGHSANLPKILAKSGFDNYLMMRPLESQQKLPKLFNWIADDDSRIRVIRVDYYDQAPNCSKDDFLKMLDACMENGEEDALCLFGVGDHGGGIYRKHLEWLMEVSGKMSIVFSTMRDYISSISKLKLPEIHGELGPCNKGCYSTCNQVKTRIARSERLLLNAEKLDCIVSLPEAVSLKAAWEEFLFNHFHDILPGTFHKRRL